MSVGTAADLDRLRSFWDQRYREFGLSESGWAGAGERFNRYIYACKGAALTAALEAAGYAARSRFDVLDAGCGQGFFADFYRQHYPQARYTGIDLSNAVVQHLRRTRPECEFHAADLTSWSAGSRRFQVVQCFEVLHLMLDDELVLRALRNFARLAAGGGVVLVTAVLPPRTSAGAYMKFRSESEFDALVAEAGLTMARKARMYYWLPDRGPSWRLARPLCMRTPDALLYYADRFAHRVGLPRVPTGPDSRMWLLTLQHRGSRAGMVPDIGCDPART